MLGVIICHANIYSNTITHTHIHLSSTYVLHWPIFCLCCMHLRLWFLAFKDQLMYDKGYKSINKGKISSSRKFNWYQLNYKSYLTDKDDIFFSFRVTLQSYMKVSFFFLRCHPVQVVLEISRSVLPKAFGFHSTMTEITNIPIFN